MEQEHELSDDACDLIMAMTMDKLAQKAGGEFQMHTLDLNPDIMAHHALRRSIVRVAYELGKTVAAVPNAEITGRTLAQDEADCAYGAPVDC